MELQHLSVKEIGIGVRAKKFSAVDVTRFFLNRIERLDPKINSFITTNPRALAEAERVDEKIFRGEEVGALAGVPVAIKDLLCTEGLRTTAGSKILENFVPPYDATVVQKLRASGAVILGKTNLDEFAMGSSNESSFFGPVRNPWNTEYVPGGSSGGSAAALAARLTPAAIGTDTGGSIRQPANFCGVYGIKPTYGRVSRYGIIAYASSLDQAGPMAHSTEDCALLLGTIAGKDPRDATSANTENKAWTTNPNTDLKNVRIGLPKEYFSAQLDADVEKTVNSALGSLRRRGAECVEISLPLTKYAVPVYYLIATSEASSNLSRYDGVRYGYRSPHPPANLEEFYAQNRGEAFGTEVKRRIMIGVHALSSGYYDAYYQKASQVRRLLRDEYLKAFETCDLILSPVTAAPAYKFGEKSQDPLEKYLDDIFTTSTNLAGLPGMSVPGGYSAQGLPIGIQLTARPFDEQRIFDIASVLEEELKAVVKDEKRVPNVI